MSIGFIAEYFHWYGCIVGCAIVVTWLLLEHLLGQKKSHHLFPTWMCCIVFGLMGARLWHVATDWHLYSSLPWPSLLWQGIAVWQGGLSILGALSGGVIGLVVARWLGIVSAQDQLLLLDGLAIALPFGQALGRVANYVNQELYGVPTKVPWGIFIEPAYRVAGYEHVEIFHPLFAYEASLLILFGCWLYLQYRSQKGKLGTGWLWWWYVLYYAVIRFGLDFIRIDKVMFNKVVSVNQVIILGGIVVILIGYQVYQLWIAKRKDVA